MTRLHEQHPDFTGEWRPAPVDYWRDWREECELADFIVVNSEWSRSLLAQEGIPNSKLQVIPLACEGATGLRDHGTTGSPERLYPDRFSTQRPLRVLFLGQVNLRKGIVPLLESLRLLRDEPVEFWIVGPHQITLPDEFRHDSRIVWTGTVARGAAADFYRRADVFLFPTFSDGFGLTQLEAQAWQLPVIASRFCGDVVQEGVNGLLLSEVSAEAIASVLRDLVGNPGRLREFSSRSGVNERFSLKSLAASLLNR